MIAAIALLLAAAASSPEPGAPAPPTAAAATPAPTPAPAPGLLAAIDAAIGAGRLDAAAAMLTRAASDHPHLRLRRAEHDLAAGNLATAAAAFTELAGEAANAADPATAAPALQGLGLVRIRQGNLPAAATALDAALARDPALSRAWSARGVAFDRVRDFAAAEAAYARALALAPRAAAVLTNRGYSRLLQGRHALAEADFTAALAIEPNLATAATNLRLARALQGRYLEAFAGSDRRRLPADLNTIGFAAMARGDDGIATSYFARALALNPRFDPVATANLAYLESRKAR